MASSVQSNPVYYSLASLSSGQNLSTRTVVLHKRPDHDGFGVYIGEDIPSGLYIVTIERNSPASDANIQPGDRVLAINGQLVSSMLKNPKEMLMEAASHAESLTLTIQSNNVLQTLDLTSTNNGKDNNDHSVKRNSSKRTSTINLDLESYIKSLFINENVQILQTSNNNEFTFKSDSYRPSSMPFNSAPNRYYYANDRKKERPRQRHSKRTHRETREIQTQTSFNDDEYPTYPTNTNSDFTAVPPYPAPNNVTRNSTENSHPPQQQHHMSDVVKAAIIAQRKQEKVNKGKETSTREPAPTAKPATTPPPARQSSDISPISSSPGIERTTTTSTSRDAAPVTTRTTTPPPSRDPAPVTTQNTTRTTTSGDAAPATTRTTTPPPPPPPPYSETTVAVVPVEAPNNQANTGAYNVRDAEGHQAAAAAAATIVEVSHDEGLREVHLQRSPDFQGFGFHLQYNKSYYLVQSVEADSPAQQAGLHANDVIHAINHQTTTNMPHGVFVDTVNSNSDIDLTVQTLDAFLRAHPPPVRNQQMAAAVAAAINNDTDKRKGGVSKTLGKLTGR